MGKKPDKTRYVLAGSVVTIAVLVAVYGLYFLLQNLVLASKIGLFDSGLLEDRVFSLITIGGVIFAVVLGYLVFLLLSLKARANLLAWSMTKELAVSHEQLRRLYEQAPIPYLLLDKKGLIGEPNKAAMRLFGMSYEELKGKDFFSLYPSEDKENVEQFKEGYIRGLPVDHKEMRVLRKDGTPVWVALSIFDMRNAASREHSGLATLFDISEQKKVDNAKTQFVSLASHQLRTPLSAIKWYTEMLVDSGVGKLGEKNEKYLNRIYENNQNMIDLVNTLLNVSRLQLGTLEPDKKDTDVREIVDSVVKELSAKAEQKKLSIEKEYEEGFESLLTDDKLLRIVVQNLVSNAVKYTPDGGIVRVRLENRGGEKRIVVEDNGYGIPKEQQDRIFSLMFRADNVKKHNVEGSGLGLFLVRQIVEVLGGSITFVSELDQGTTFTVTFK